MLDYKRIRIREAQKHVDPGDLDPEHCTFFPCFFQCCVSVCLSWILIFTHPRSPAINFTKLKIILFLEC